MKTVLITGATNGIGKAVALGLAKQGYTIIIHGRNREKTNLVCEQIKAETGNATIETIIADLYLLKNVKIMADEIIQRFGKLDVLVNNAGGLMGKEREITDEGFEKTIALNLLVPFLLTTLMLGLLKASEDGRIINVSSNSHQLNAKPNFEDLSLEVGYSPLRAYGNSKLFLIWITRHLATLLLQSGITNVTVNSLHPGAVATNFGVESNLGPFLNFFAKIARPLFKSAEQGADTIIYLASSMEVKGVSGKYFVNKKESKVEEKYYSINQANRVWEYCLEQTRPYSTT